MSDTFPVRRVDPAMYRSEPMPNGKPGPRVILLNATPDPLGSLAALCAMYEGRVIRDLRKITDEQRRQAFADMGKTALSGPLEVAQFHFLVEGVTRALTHQMVRERMAFFAQESMRFAVVEGQPWKERVALPPSLAETTGDVRLGTEDDNVEYARNIWDEAIHQAELSYVHLLNAGMPAEDARGLMPHAMTTRLHWVLDLRGLMHVAGLRLCTQAQFEWRLVMAQVVKALRAYASEHHDGWQFRHIAKALLPVCYQQGRCGFMAQFDRGCTIRGRVEANAALGRPSSEWDQDYISCAGDGMPTVKAIQPAEWAADPTAARRTQ